MGIFLENTIFFFIKINFIQMKNIYEIELRLCGCIFVKKNIIPNLIFGLEKKKRVIYYNNWINYN